METPFVLRTSYLVLALWAAAAPAIDFRWRVDPAKAAPAEFDLYRGETAVFRPEFPGTNIQVEALCWQTNGMGSAWWTVPGATFAPSNDVGAAKYRFFVRATDGTVVYRANGSLRMLGSPGESPNALPIPPRTIDFAEVDVANAPWATPADLSSKVSKSGDIMTGRLGIQDNHGEIALMEGELDLRAEPTKVSPEGYEWLFFRPYNIVLATGGGQRLTELSWPSAGGTLARIEDIPDISLAGVSAADATNIAERAASAAEASARGYADAAAESTRAIVATWEQFLDGSNVVFSITNYVSGAYSPDAAKLRITELRDGAYREVYNSRDEILMHVAAFSNGYVRVALDALADEVAARLAAKADRDWGKYTSAGGDAPSNTVYMTAPQTVFAGGLEYERVAVGEGAVCVLSTRGAPVYAVGDEGTFKFQTDGGTNYFGFSKTDSYTIGCDTDGISASGGVVTLSYSVTMSGVPCVWYKADIAGAEPWEQLNTPDGEPVEGASHVVQWEENPEPGTETCYIAVGDDPRGFFRATVEAAGSAKFETNMPADFSAGVLCTDGATIIYPHADGTWGTSR